MGQECFQRLEACIDALHSPALIAVGDLTADSSFLILGCLWTQRDVGQAEGQNKNFLSSYNCFSTINVQLHESVKQNLNMEVNQELTLTSLHLLG